MNLKIFSDTQEHYIASEESKQLRPFSVSIILFGLYLVPIAALAIFFTQVSFPLNKSGYITGSLVCALSMFTATVIVGMRSGKTWGLFSFVLYVVIIATIDISSFADGMNVFHYIDLVLFAGGILLALREETRDYFFRPNR